jgi:hypothetical protein
MTISCPEISRTLYSAKLTEFDTSKYKFGGLDVDIESKSKPFYET